MQKSQSLRDLFEAAIELAPAARAAFLDLRCADTSLRARVERLLLADADAAALFSGGARAAALAIGDAELAEALPPGSRIGPFDLVAVLGEGGSSTVFHARREMQGVRQDVALKVLRRGLYSPDAQRQFRRERLALGQLQHPGIARLIEGGVTDNGLAYIALDLVEGRPITDYARDNRLDLRARLGLFLQVCRAVEAAHRALIVHRDLKPSNVLVTADGQVKLLDFGIAKLLDRNDETQTRLPAFTPAYAAPEQRDGGLITTATDVYALGILLGELVTGQRLTGQTGRTPSSQITGGEAVGALPAPAPVTRRALRGDLDNIVLKAIEIEPERRYASAGAMADDVERMLDGRPVAAHPPSRMYRARKFIQRHRGGVAATVLFLLALMTAFGIAIWQAKVARDAARSAEREAARANATKDFLVRVFRASAQQALRIETTRVGTQDHSIRCAVSSITRGGDATRDERQVGVAERLAQDALSIRIRRSDREIRLGVPRRGDRCTARHAHRGRADRDAVEVGRIPLREHHALPSAARAADEVLAIGCAAVIARDEGQRDRRGAFVGRIGMIDARDGIETELRGRTLMARVRCHDRKAALQAGVRKRPCIASDRRRDDAVVAAATLIQEAAAPRGRKTKLEARLIRLSVCTSTRRC